MKRVKDNEDPPDDYWKESTQDEDPPRQTPRANKFLEEISISDLCDGKEVMFQTAPGFMEDFDDDDDDDICGDVPHYNPKAMRENRGAPPLNRSFREIASTMTDITENGFVKKQIISNGVGLVVPEHAYVTIHYNLYKESCELPFDSTYLRNRPEKFKLGHGEAFPGLDCAVKSMKKNENSLFFIKWEMAFGILGCPDRIEGKCDIVADITLISFTDLQECSYPSGEDTKQSDFSNSINQAKKLICNGSDEFSKGNERGAAACYRRAVKILSSMKLANEEEEKIMFDQKLKCFVNLAICYNKLGRYEQACVACQQALSIDSNNVKANFHYGKASVSLSNFPVAERCLFKANRLKPNDKDINNELKRLNDKKAIYEIKDKLFWKKALSVEKQGETSQSEEKESSPLEGFEKQLLSSLEESLKPDKPYVLPGLLSEDEIKICQKVAAEKNADFETKPGLSTFKMKIAKKN